MKSISCIAIDDEPLALLVIEQFCNRMGGLELRTFSEPHVGLQAILEERPRLVFLDIEMNASSGIEIARRLPTGCLLIFTTAHARYALDGFELNAVDFLHKPFSYERFERAIQKAAKLLDTEPVPETIVVKQEYNNVTIPVEQILYVEAMENYIKIFRKDEEYVLSRISLKTLQEMLPYPRFLRIHRSYLVAADKVVSFSKRDVKLVAGGEEKVLPIGRQYVQEVYQTLCGL